MLKTCLSFTQASGRLCRGILLLHVLLLPAFSIAAPSDGNDLTLEERMELAQKTGLLRLLPSEDLHDIAWLIAEDNSELKDKIYNRLLKLNADEFGNYAPTKLGSYLFINLPNVELLTQTEGTTPLVKDSTTPTPPAKATKQAAKTTSRDANAELSIETRIRAARIHGYLTMWPGETVFKVAQIFAPDDPVQQQKIYAETIRLNKSNADINPDSKFDGYVRVRIPAYLLADAPTINVATETPTQSIAVKPTPEKSIPKAPAQVVETLPTTEIAQTPSLPADTETPAPPTPAPETLPRESVTATQAVRDTTPTESSVYSDQLIDPGSGGGLLFGDESSEEREQPVGRRIFSAEYTHYQSDRNQGSLSEDVASLRWLRETVNYGELEFDATVNNVNPSDNNIPPSKGTTGVFTLYQRDFALNSNWKMDNAAGLVRSITPQNIASSYRIQLPSSLLTGINTRVHDKNRDIRFSVGRTGNLDGINARDFEDTDGLLMSASYLQNANAQWLLGGQWVSLQDHESITDHSSFATFAQYTHPRFNQHYQLHTLLDSEGQAGIWFDGTARTYRLQHRYGLFQLDPELLWTDTAITNDQRGLYYRGDLNLRRQKFSAGLDWTQTDISNDPGRTGSDTISTFVSATHRKNTRTSVGGTLGYSLTESELSSEDTTNTLRITGYASHRFDLGTSRAQLANTTTDNGNENINTTRLDMTQDWNISRYHQLGTAFSYETQSNSSSSSGNDRNQYNASVLFRSEIMPQLFANGSISVGQVDNLSGSQDVANARLGALWVISPSWEASLELSWNRPDIQEIAGLTLGDDENNILLRVRYSASKGRPPRYYGSSTDSAGYGKLLGEVFLDDNGDGIRQANEAIAPNITVLLDGRHTQTTDSKGSFEFWPVSTGEHNISVAIEDVPLPWGLDDEEPQKIQIETRGRTTIAIPLVKLSE